MNHDNYRPGRLSLSTMNQGIIRAEYAVRGELVIKALEIQRTLDAGSDNLPFNEVIFCNIGNPQQLGQPPITFIRQVLALAEWPPLIEEKGLFPEDAIDRGKRILAESSGSIGAYSHSQGLKIIREAVISFIKSRDLVGFQARSSCLSHEAQSSIRDAQNTNSSSKANTNDKYPFNHNKIEKKLVNKLDQMDLTFDGEISANDIFLCNGASEGVRMALQILIADKKSAIMIPYPQYPLYSALINVIGGQIIPYALDESNGWSIDTKGLEEIYQSAIKDGFIIRGFVLINPGNPTGSYFEPEVIEDVMKFCKTHDITLMADEVYQSNIHLPNKKFISCLQILIGLEEKNSSFREQTLLSFHSVSKGLLGECGHRGGYMHCYNLDPLVREQLYKLASISLCPNLPGQLCVWLMVDPPSMGDPSYILFENECRSIREALARKASYLHDRLTEMEGITCQIATGALYLYPRIQLPLAFVNHCDESKSPDTAYALELLSATGICVVPGSGFGQMSGTYHIRTTFLPSEDKLEKFSVMWGKFHDSFMRQIDRRMEAVIGIRGLDYVLLASDRRAARSIVVMKSTEVKTRDLSRSVGMAYCGEPGSAVEFAEYVQANTRLYAVRNGYSLTASEAAHYARRLLADALRTRSPYQTNILVGGFGGLEENSVKPEQKNASKEGPRLYTIDHLATLAELPFAAHGYAAYFVLSLMDRHYRPEMTLEEGMALLRMCLAELKTRFIVGLPEFTVQIIKPSGIQETILSS